MFRLTNITFFFFVTLSNIKKVSRVWLGNKKEIERNFPLRMSRRCNDTKPDAFFLELFLIKTHNIRHIPTCFLTRNISEKKRKPSEDGSSGMDTALGIRIVLEFTRFPFIWIFPSHKVILKSASRYFSQVYLIQILFHKFYPFFCQRMTNDHVYLVTTNN